METPYDRTEQLQAARQVLATKLNGKSPRQRGAEKTNLALDWIYRWGWSSPRTIEQVGGAIRSGLAARLVKNGLLRSTRTESGGGVRGVPTAMLTLTELGLQEVERIRTELFPYELDPYRIRQDQLRHYQLAQTATANALARGAIAGFQTERELAEQSADGVKQPDILWHLPNGQRCAVEVELTAKWNRQLDQFVRGCLLSLAAPQGQRPRFDLIAVVSDSPAILSRYKAAFAAGATYHVWNKDAASRWVQGEAKKVPEWGPGRMQWRLIES